MIWESKIWKDALLESSRKVADIARLDSQSDDDLGCVEREIMIGFFSVRKLLEAKTKLSISTRDQKWSLQRWHVKKDDDGFPIKPDLMNRHRIDEFYNFGEPHSVELSLQYLCDQIIHSFVFTYLCDENGAIDSVVFVSDKDKKKFLNGIKLKTIVRILCAVGNDYPTTLEMSRDEDGEWVVDSAANASETGIA